MNNNSNSHNKPMSVIKTPSPVLFKKNTTNTSPISNCNDHDDDELMSELTDFDHVS
jgi:hypothetical protein